jgi:hypothetical protein
MLKPLLLGAAMAIALPAFAQTTGSSNLGKPPMGTSTNDDRGNAGMSGGALGNQTSPGVPDQSATADCSQGVAARTARSATRRGTRGTAASTCGRMQAPMQSSASTQSDSGWGTTGAGTTAGTSGSSSWNSGSSAYAGQGGPLETGKTYPRCSRAVTDNCTQRGGGHSRHHRR